MVEIVSDKKEPVIEKKLGFDLGNINFWLPLLIEALILVLVFFSMRETLNFLFADDDLMTSLYKAQFLGGVTIRSFLKFEYVHTVEQIKIGRFMVGGFLAYLPMLFFDIVQYRAYVLMLVCANVWVFGKCIYQWTDSYKMKWFAMLLSPLFFQIHFNFHHPILSYYGGMQLLFLIFFLSMFFFWKYCKTANKGWLFISGALYVWGILTYEIIFALLPVFILLAYLATKSIKKAITFSLTHVSLFSSFLIVNLINRVVSAKTVSNYSGSSFNLDIPKIITTTLKQMSATIPLSDFFAINWVINKTLLPKLFLIINITPGDLLTVILFLVILFLIYRTIETKWETDGKYFLVFGSIGFLIILLPASLMGLSDNYQNIISWGIGHIPVYFQYYGLIIFLISVFILIRNKLKNHNVPKVFTQTIRVSFVALYIFILLVNQQYGRDQLNNFDKVMYDNMLALQYALEDHLIEDIPVKALIVNSQVIPTGLSKSDYSSRFFVTYSHKRLKNVVYVDDFTEKVISGLKAQGKITGNNDYMPTQPTYIVRSNKDKDEGVIYIGRVKNATVNLDDQKIIRYEIDQLKIYTMKSVVANYVSLYEKSNDQSYKHKYYELDPKLVTSGKNGRIYQLDFQDTVDFNSSFLVNDINTIESGFYDVETFSVKISTPVIVANKRDAGTIFSSGWYGIEPWGIWSESNRSEMVFLLTDTPTSDLLVKLNTQIFAPVKKLNFSVRVNGSFAGNYSLPSGNQTLTIPVSKLSVIKNSNLIKIVFDIKNPSSPAQAGLSADERPLGIGVISFVVEPAKK